MMNPSTIVGDFNALPPADVVVRPALKYFQVKTVVRRTESDAFCVSTTRFGINLLTRANISLPDNTKIKMSQWCCCIGKWFWVTQCVMAISKGWAANMSTEPEKHSSGRLPLQRHKPSVCFHMNCHTHIQCTVWDISSWSRWWTVFLLAQWQPHCRERKSSQWNIDLTPIHSLSCLLSCSLSLFHTRTVKQVGLICCIGHCQSSSLSCGNRSLMISIPPLCLSGLGYIYFCCWTLPPFESPVVHYHLFSLFPNNFIRLFRGSFIFFKKSRSYVLRTGSHCARRWGCFNEILVVKSLTFASNKI